MYGGSEQACSFNDNISLKQDEGSRRWSSLSRSLENILNEDLEGIDLSISYLVLDSSPISNKKKKNKF